MVKQRVSKKVKKETKDAIGALNKAVSKFTKTEEFFARLSYLIKDAIADWCIRIVGYGEKKLNVYPGPGPYFYYLADAGATAFSKYPKKISEKPELLKITQLAALCFPYTPALNANFYFTLEKNDIILHNQTDNLSSYFYFLKKLLVEKNIDFTIRLACLSGALQFYIVYRKYLTNAFIENLFFLLNSFEAKSFFLEYKQEFKEQMNILRIYIPNYQFLVRQTKEYWDEIVISPDSEAWISSLKEEITRAIKADNAFIKERKLTHFSLLNKEFEKFIQLLFLDKDKGLKEEISLLSRTANEQISSFTDENHPLREFFSAELLNSLRKKNQFKPQRLLEECEYEENERIKYGLEKQLAIQRDELEKKARNEQLELERKNERKIEEVTEKKEKEFKELCMLINKFSFSLQRSIKFINELTINPEKKDKSIQQFKTEFGKLSPVLKAIYKLISFEKEYFIINNIYNALVEIENKVKNNKNFLEKKINLLCQEIDGIKAILENVKQSINDIIQKINKIYTDINRLNTKHFDLCNSLIKKEKITDKIRRELKNFSSDKKKLISKFYDAELALREYNQIFPLSIEQTTQLNNLFFNIEAMEKLSGQLDKRYKVDFTSEEKLKKKTKPNVKSTQSKVNSVHASTNFLFKTVPINVKDQRLETLPTGLLSKKYDESITDLKERFFLTLAVVHLVSKITFSQGRGRLAYIYIEKLTAYKKKVKEIGMSLLKKETSLNSIENNYIKARLYEEKRELERLDRLIDSLVPLLRIYGAAAREFYQVNFEKYTFNKLLYYFKKELIPETVRVELIQKGFLSEDEVNQEDLFSQTQKLEARLRENKLLLDNAFFSNAGDMEAIEKENAALQEFLDKKYSELEQINKNFQDSFIAGQEYSPPDCEIAINYPRVLPLISVIPVALVPVTVIAAIRIGQPVGFFQVSATPITNNLALEEENVITNLTQR